MTVIQDQRLLPDDEFRGGWQAIKIPDEVRERLTAQVALSIRIRSAFSFEIMPIHGLIVLAGPPGTGKTTLAGGLADRVAGALDTKAQFIAIDPHALTGAALGKSQREVSKLFDQTIPELAAQDLCFVLLDEVETLAVDRQQLSLDANPVDVHRATDAVLAGLDALTRRNSNVILIATTNYPDAVDPAFMSRADHVEVIGLPDLAARREIITDVLTTLSREWPPIRELLADVEHFASRSEGLDGRRLRKTIVSAMAASIDIAQDPAKLGREHILRAISRQTEDTTGAKPKAVA